MELLGEVCGLAVHASGCSATSDARIRNTKIVVPAQAGTTLSVLGPPHYTSNLI